MPSDTIFIIDAFSWFIPSGLPCDWQNRQVPHPASVELFALPLYEYQIHLAIDIAIYCPGIAENRMWFVSDALRGDIAAAADKSFDCLMCGLCAARCPQGLVPYNVAILCRRLYGHNLAPVSQHVLDRIAEIESGKFDSELSELKKAIRRNFHASTPNEI